MATVFDILSNNVNVVVENLFSYIATNNVKTCPTKPIQVHARTFIGGVDYLYYCVRLRR